MNISNQTSFFDNESLLRELESSNPCPRQRSITRPLLSIHNYSLLFFGSIFNFLAFFILIRRSLRCHSTFAYLAMLSFTNGLLSLVHFSKWMFKYYFNFPFESYLVTCRFHRFSSDFLTHFSLYTLIFVNIDRARTVTRNRPSLKHPKSRFRMVLMRELLVAGILGAFHFHWIIKYGYEVTDGDVTIARCVYDESQSSSLYYYFLTTIYPPLELIVFLCLPLLINIFCTILIVRSLSIRMRAARQFRPTNNGTEKSNSNQKSLMKSTRGLLTSLLPQTPTKSGIFSCLCFQMQCRRHTRLRLKVGRTKQSLIRYAEENQTCDQQRALAVTATVTEDNPSQVVTSVASAAAAAAAARTSHILNKQHRARRTRDIHLSAMLIGLNIFYLILNLPFNLFQTFAKHFYNPNSDPCDMMFIGVLLDALQQTFFSTNFFLYILTNRRFREEFYNTFIQVIPLRCQKQKTSSPTMTNAPNSSRARVSSCIPSTTFVQAHPNNSTHPISCAIMQVNRDSTNSDIELTESMPGEQHETLESRADSHRCISKLVMFKELSSSSQHQQ